MDKMRPRILRRHSAIYDRMRHMVRVRDRITNPAIRLVLVISALALVWWAEDRRIAAQQRYSETFDVQWGMTFVWWALVVVSGLLVGLSGLPSLQRSYRWKIALLISVPPALLLGQFVLASGYLLPNDVSLAGGLDDVTVFSSIGPQFVLTFMIGLGIATGFATSGSLSPTERIPRSATQP